MFHPESSEPSETHVRAFGSTSLMISVVLRKNAVKSCAACVTPSVLCALMPSLYQRASSSFQISYSSTRPMKCCASARMKLFQPSTASAPW